MKRSLLSFLVFLFCLCPVSASAQGGQGAEPLSAKTIAVCNKAMKAIFDDAVSLKGDYKELSQLDEKALRKNDLGIYLIDYTYKEKVEQRGGGFLVREPYGFLLTVTRMDDRTYDGKKGAFAYGFPAIGVKIVGYQNRKLMRTPFNILDLISKYGRTIDAYEQQFLPLRLEVTTDKPVYAVDEPVEYRVTLTNVSKVNMVVKKPSAETLLMSVNGELWGNTSGDNSPGGLSRQEILRQSMAGGNKYGDPAKVSGMLFPGQAFEMTLRGEGFSDPQDVQVEVIYQVPYRDVYPTAYYSFKVTAKDPEAGVTPP